MIKHHIRWTNIYKNEYGIRLENNNKNDETYRQWYVVGRPPSWFAGEQSERRVTVWTCSTQMNAWRQRRPSISMFGPCTALANRVRTRSRVDVTVEHSRKIGTGN